MEVLPVNTAVTDPRETVIATNAVPQWAGARDDIAHRRIACNSTANKRLAGDATGALLRLRSAGEESRKMPIVTPHMPK
jgi:hypothetical protein